MTVKRNLGTGLDVLLTAAQGQPGKAPESTMIQGQSLFDQALKHDEIGDSLEAYHLYRQVIDLIDTGDSIAEIAELISRSCNNIAVIFFENAQTEAALSFLQRAIDICPQNRTARENMKRLKLD